MDLVLALVGVLAVLHVAYSLWTAKRLDRLHTRLDAARAALDRQLRQRAEAALASAGASAGAGRSAPARDVAAAARAALDVRGLGHDREVAENALSRMLLDVADADLSMDDVITRTSFARRFHNDAVRDVLVVRRRRIVRWFHLAGRAPLPTYFEMDDSVLDRRTIEV